MVGYDPAHKMATKWHDKMAKFAIFLIVTILSVRVNVDYGTDHDVNVVLRNLA